MSNNEGIGYLKLECPQSHPVGRILKEVPHQAVQYDPGAQVGPRRFWPQEDDQPQFQAHCRFCDRPVAADTATLQRKFRAVIEDASATHGAATLPYA
ncbi:hypothetical protein H7H78_01375 [Mycobacterium shinjukuense]|uniref:Uncharacterized protein n=1 Tax=Mycobacterium shinjukuense TaxID=398694 RepID=A0A7I7MRB7_9MYCO|nr:hypothetical protein [Mycobacterium shinjukuense]MCV6984149.1 hypothetical protein [Mycobacterium shinjukuense]ORB70268.1 hypothetical protein BST45_07115 [Mycobacterium shinjukuense]BBX74103.1 hypothetical protein MSHI_20090 [Mycobacterium shinjukuense]